MLGACTMHVKVYLYVSQGILPHLHRLVLYAIPYHWKHCSWLGRYVRDDCIHGGLSLLCRYFLCQAAHSQQVRVQDVTERVEMDPESDGKLRIQLACVHSDRCT